MEPNEPREKPIPKVVDKCCNYCGEYDDGKERNDPNMYGCKYWMINLKRFSNWDVDEDYCTKFFLRDKINHKLEDGSDS